MTTINTCRQSERGNVLFLILIAVALFAALSYVVTQSTRSGGGTTEREQNILSSAQMTQYPTALRTSIIRMILGGTPIENIIFNDPASFGSLSVNRLVFHPQGGGAVFQQAPAELMQGGVNPGAWNFNANYHVRGLGIDTANGNDVIAFLPGISSGVCKQTNDELGIGAQGTPCATAIAGTSHVAPEMDGTTGATLSANITDASATFPTAAGVRINTALANCVGVFDRQASGCFWDATGSRYVFYSVLLER